MATKLEENQFLSRALKDGQQRFEDRRRRISNFMETPGAFEFTVPDGDGCKSLPNGSTLYVSPYRVNTMEGLHILENVKTGERIARWIDRGIKATHVTAFKMDGSDPVDKMVIDLSGPVFEWISVGQAKFSMVYLGGGNDIQHGPDGTEEARQIAA